MLDSAMVNIISTPSGLNARQIWRQNSPVTHHSKFRVSCFRGQKNRMRLHQVRTLLYAYYVKELHWDIVPDNPSGIKINDQSLAPQLEDDYDQAALWFVLRDPINVIACARLCLPDREGFLEIERYDNARRVLKPLLKAHKEHLIELSREAIAVTYVDNIHCYWLLLHAIFTYCLETDKTLLTTTNIVEWAKAYQEIGFANDLAYQFKYFNHEPKPVDVYLADKAVLTNTLEWIEWKLNQ